MEDSDSPNDTKRTKRTHQTQNDDLLPGLPDHLAQVCLSHVNPSTLFSVSRAWRRLLYAPTFPPFHALYALLSRADQNSLHLHSFDPLAGAWIPLPPPPLDVLLRHPSFMSRNLPVQSLSVSGKALLLLAATTHNLSPALPHPLLFHPATATWTVAPTLAARRWCAAGALRGRAYVASGIGSQFSLDVARSVERLDLGENCGARWERLGDLKDGRFSREAVEAVGWRGKLCMVNVKGGAMKDGAVYDEEKGEWGEMAPGMLSGLRGPAAAMEEEVMFVVDEGDGVLRRYCEGNDEWVDVAQSHTLKGAEHVAAAGGRVCVVCAGRKSIVVVDVVSDVGRMWEVDVPSGLQALTVHVLPRVNSV